MLVVSDTSPITALLQVERAGLLKDLFARVVIPPAVKTELIRFHRRLPEFLETREIEDRNAVDVLARELDRGEAESIVLAQQLGAHLLLMDEKRGRSTAEANGLAVVGLLGVLLMAKQQRLIPRLGPVIAELETRAGFFVSETVKRIILAAADEGADRSGQSPSSPAEPDG